MKAIVKKLFPFSAAGTNYFEEKRFKFEVVSCPRKEMICQEHLSIINNCYVESEQYFYDKDFNCSIDTLKDAFYKTTELVDLPCNKCVELFRSTINESLTNMHTEIEKMASGFFGKKIHQSSCLKAENVLNEFSKFKLHNAFQNDEYKKRIIEKFPKKKVS